MATPDWGGYSTALQTCKEAHVKQILDSLELTGAFINTLPQPQPQPKAIEERPMTTIINDTDTRAALELREALLATQEQVERFLSLPGDLKLKVKTGNLSGPVMEINMYKMDKTLVVYVAPKLMGLLLQLAPDAFEDAVSAEHITSLMKSWPARIKNVEKLIASCKAAVVEKIQAAEGQEESRLFDR